MTALALPACRDASTTINRKPSGFIAVVGVGQDDPHWPVMTYVAKKADADRGLYQFPIRAAAPRQSSIHLQRAMLEELQDEGMVGVCVQVTDAAALLPTIEALASAGISVVTLFQPVSSKSPFPHAGLDDHAIGEALADAVAADLATNSTLALLHADSVSEASTRRHTAFRGRWAAGQSIQRIVLEFDCKADRKTAEFTVRDTMQRYPRLGGWVFMDDWPLHSVLDDAALVPKGCQMFVATPTPGCWKRMTGGEIVAVVAPDYEQLVDNGLTACVAGLMGGVGTPTRFETPNELVRAGDFETLRKRWESWGVQLETSVPKSTRDK